MRTPRAALCGALLGLSVTVLVPSADAESQGEANRRVRVTAGELEHSTAAVRKAAASLDAVAAQLPGAQRSASIARGELAGAQARLAEAISNVRKAELATGAAQRQVDEATGAVERDRQTIDGLARRSFQQGPLGNLIEIFRAGSPQDVVDRAETIKKVFRGQNDALHDMTVSRLRLAGRTAELEVQQGVLEDAQSQARAGQGKAAAVTAQAEQAAARVAELVAQRTTALADAESARADDVAAYKEANNQSRALAAQLRALAAERARQAARDRTRIPVISNGRFTQPTVGRLTSPFGYRRHPIYGDIRFHPGIDIGAPSGTPIWAAEAGTVIEAGLAGGYGIRVLISHGTYDGRDIVTAYAHMSAALVSAGQRVGRGQEIGRVGSTGNSTGPHLHFEVRRNGDPDDPLNWISAP